MGAIASLITSLTIVYSTIYSDADQRKHQSSASLAFGWGIHRGPVKSPHKWPVTRKMFPFDDVIMWSPLPRETIAPLFYLTSTMTADVLVTQDTKAPTTMIPSRFSNIQGSVGISLFMRQGNDSRCYIVTPSLIGWAHTQSDSWLRSKRLVNSWLALLQNLAKINFEWSALLSVWNPVPVCSETAFHWIWYLRSISQTDEELITHIYYKNGPRLRGEDVAF